MNNKISRALVLSFLVLMLIGASASSASAASWLTAKYDISVPTSPSTAGDAPLTVKFTDKTTPTPDSWFWSFGDGTTSTEQNPTHTYISAGRYSPKLEVEKAGYTSVWVKKSIIVTGVVIVPIIPVANFTFTPNHGYTPLEVQFTDASVNATSYAWKFGTEGTSTEKNPKFTFTTAGNKAVTLTVTSATGRTATKTATILVTTAPIPAPVADFTYTPASGDVPLTVKFTDASTNAVSYAWVFDKEGTSTEKSPEFTFTKAGEYNVTLTVNNSEGVQSSKTQLVTATNAPIVPVIPVADFSFTGEGDAPATVEFTDKSTNAESYAWDFGDSGVSTDQNPKHEFTKDGTYSVVLEVTSSTGNTSKSTQSVVITKKVIQPVADFTFSPATGDSPLLVTFTDGSTDAVSYEWDFNEDAVVDSTDKNPTYTYNTDGIHKITLTVKSEDGLSANKTKEIAVNAPIIPGKADFTFSPATGDVPVTIQFTDASTGTGINSYNWSFGDSGDANIANPTHTYNTAGTYDVKLIITSADGTHEVTKQLVLTNAPVIPVAGFTFTPTSGEAPLTVQFTDASTAASTLVWTFKDSDGVVVGTNTTANPEFTFVKAGNYTIELKAKSTDGNEDTEIKSITVSETPVVITPVVAGFSNENTFLRVVFTDISSGSPEGYAWDFGDSVVSSEQNPVHVYTSAGTYKVNLTVLKAGTASSSIERDVTVSAEPVVVTPVVALFQGTPTYLSVAFADQSTGSPTAFSWTFGDGSVSAEQNPTHVYATAGTYNVNLTVSKDGTPSNSTETSFTITAKPEDPVIVPIMPVADFTANKTSGDAPLCVSFTSTSQNATSLVFDVNGDGITEANVNGNVVYTFATAGTYTASLNASNENGSSVKSMTITVNKPTTPPVIGLKAAFSADVVSGEMPLKVKFTQSSTGTIVRSVWDFGDGITSSTPNATHTFTKAGTYTVSLTVYNATTRNTEVKKGYITVKPKVVAKPVADFSGTPTSGKKALTVKFTDKSTNNPTSYYWVFGCGCTSKKQNPEHTYTAKGKYTVTLTVKNAAGTSVKTVKNYITVK